MFTNAEMLEEIIKSKGYTVYAIHKAMNGQGNVYYSFKKNSFTKVFLEHISEIIGEDVTMFANCFVERVKGNTSLNKVCSCCGKKFSLFMYDVKRYVYKIKDKNIIKYQCGYECYMKEKRKIEQD